MMYFALNKQDHSFVFSTNIKAVSEFTGIPYHKAYAILSNGEDLKETDDYLFARGNPRKGKQRIQAIEPEEKKPEKKKPPGEMKDFNDFFDEIK